MGAQERILDLKRRIQAIEWDIGKGSFNKKKTMYYESLRKEHDALVKKHELC